MNAFESKTTWHSNCSKSQTAKRHQRKTETTNVSKGVSQCKRPQKKKSGLSVAAWMLGEQEDFRRI